MCSGLRSDLSAYSGEKKKKLLLLGIPLVLLTVLSATDGFQMILTVFFPVCGAICLERFFDTDNKLTVKSCRPSLLTLAVILISLAVGLVLMFIVTKDISAGYANAYSSYDTSANWFKNIGSTFKNFFSLFGYDTAYGTKFTSAQSFSQVCHIFAVVLILTLPLLMFTRYKKLEDRGVKLLLWVHSLETFVILFGCIFGQLSAANWRLVPIFCTALLVIICFVRHLADSPTLVLPRLSSVLTLFLCIIAAFDLSALYTLPHYVSEPGGSKAFTDYLESKGLTYGYSSFWPSHAHTVISDGRVKIRTIVLDGEKITPYSFQSEPVWYVDNGETDDYFLVLTDGEYSDIKHKAYWQELSADIVETLTYESSSPIHTGTYYILVFDENIV